MLQQLLSMQFIQHYYLLCLPVRTNIVSIVYKWYISIWQMRAIFLVCYLVAIMSFKMYRMTMLAAKKQMWWGKMNKKWTRNDCDGGGGGGGGGKQMECPWCRELKRNSNRFEGLGRQLKVNCIYENYVRKQNNNGKMWWAAIRRIRAMRNRNLFPN